MAPAFRPLTSAFPLCKPRPSGLAPREPLLWEKLPVSTRTARIRRGQVRAGDCEASLKGAAKASLRVLSESVPAARPVCEGKSSPGKNSEWEQRLRRQSPLDMSSISHRTELYSLLVISREPERGFLVMNQMQWFSIESKLEMPGDVCGCRCPSRGILTASCVSRTRMLFVASPTVHRTDPRNEECPGPKCQQCQP